MKHTLAAALARAAKQLATPDFTPLSAEQIQLTRAKENAHGDWASNLALVLAPKLQAAPRQLAGQLVELLEPIEGIAKCEVAGPGFINFFLSPDASLTVIGQILDQAERFGELQLGAGCKAQVEFVSANPTGPLHIGHGRGAAYGATIANLLTAAGYSVQREYYVNDAGRQMDILAISVWLRCLECLGETLSFPEGAYQGDYVKRLAEQLCNEHGEQFLRSADDVFAELPTDGSKAQADKRLDALIVRAKILLGEPLYRKIYVYALNSIRQDIEHDLADFGVVFDRWFSEQSLSSSGEIDAALKQLRDQDHLYDHQGASWFRATQFGDSKDRVVIRENGEKTYFASDIAYFKNKRDRGFNRCIYILGADHHGYVARIKAIAKALNDDPNSVEIKLVQFANLYEDGEKVAMSTRAGKFVTLRQLREDIGTDAARFFYVMRRCEQHMDFDLELARKKSADNPVYYVQMAHARVNAVFRQLGERGYSYDKAIGLSNLTLLSEPHERELVDKLEQYPETLQRAAEALEPHLLTHYLRELAQGLHTYYNAHVFLVEHEALRNARLTLIHAVKQVIANGLKLLGVNAPESM